MNSCSNSCSKKVPRLGGLGVGGWGFGYRVVKDIEVPPLDVGDRIVVDVGIRHGCCRRDERGGTGREGDCVFSDLLGCPEAGWCWLLPVGHRLFLGTSMAGRRAARGWQRWGGWGQWGKRNVTLSWNCVSLCTPPSCSWYGSCSRATPTPGDTMGARERGPRHRGGVRESWPTARAWVCHAE